MVPNVSVAGSVVPLSLLWSQAIITMTDDWGRETEGGLRVIIDTRTSL